MKKNQIAALLIAASIFLTIPAPSFAQNNEGPQVSTVMLKVVRNQDGSQSVITPKGDLAPLPGAGVAGDAAEIYMGSQGGFWYQDMTGQTVDLNAAVQALQARRQRASAHQIPQYAPQPYYPEQQTQNTTQTTTQSTGSGALAAVGTAAAAGMGAMAGAAMSNNYYNAPYGTPMYYGAHGSPYYYNNNNERQTFSDLNANQQAVLYNKRKNTVNNQAEAVQHAQTSQQNRQEQYQTSQQNRQSQYQSAQQTRQTEYQNNQNIQANRTQMAQEAQANRSGSQHQENYQRQQQWYQQQVAQNPGRFQKSESNPFTAQGGGGFGQARAEGGGGRFSEARAEGGGRFSGERASGRSFSGGGGRVRRR